MYYHIKKGDNNYKTASSIKQLISTKGLNITNNGYGTSLAIPLFFNNKTNETEVLLIKERYKPFWSFVEVA